MSAPGPVPRVQMAHLVLLMERERRERAVAVAQLPSRRRVVPHDVGGAPSRPLLSE